MPNRLRRHGILGRLIFVAAFFVALSTDAWAESDDRVGRPHITQRGYADAELRRLAPFFDAFEAGPKFCSDRAIAGAPGSTSLQPEVPHESISVSDLQKELLLGSNFAGCLRIVTYQCGVTCAGHVILEIGTGRIVETIRTNGGYAYRRDSRLFVDRDAKAVIDDEGRWIGNWPTDRLYIWNSSNLEERWGHL